MRYIHRDVTAVCEFIADNSLTITKLPLSGGSPAELFSVQDIEDMLKKSHKLWGTNLDYFFVVAASGVKKSMDLKKAVEYAESGDLNGFILIAYQDGGIISVSRIVYPFQEGAELAAWWYV